MPPLDRVVPVRLATVADIPRIFAVRTGVRENHLSLAQLAALGITPDTIASMLQTADCAWVCACDGDVVGFSMVDLDDGVLFAAFVLPEHEGRGIGRALVEVAEAALFARHATIGLETAASSRAAGFYRHLGWQVVASLDGGDGRMQRHRAPR